MKEKEKKEYMIKDKLCHHPLGNYRTWYQRKNPTYSYGTAMAPKEERTLSVAGFRAKFPFRSFLRLLLLKPLPLYIETIRS